jgi:hypothetical protein
MNPEMPKPVIIRYYKIFRFAVIGTCFLAVIVTGETLARLCGAHHYSWYSYLLAAFIAIDSCYLIKKWRAIRAKYALLLPKPAEYSNSGRQSGRQMIRSLLALRWLLSKENREHVELAVSDLSRQRDNMLSEGHGSFYIRVCVLIDALRCTVPILWDAFMRLLRQFVGAAELIRKIIGKG